MSLLIDTSVWSLGLRRDVESRAPQIDALRAALLGDEIVVTTGLILQELLQGFAGPTSRAQILESFNALAFIQPDRQDHVAAAELRNTCRRAGVQLGTIDALLAQLCVRHRLTLLTTDNDFVHATKYCKLTIWAPGDRPAQA